jgi:putative membrane protein
MNAVGLVAASLAALVHVAIFWMEAIAFRRPAVHRRFLLREPAEVAVVAPWAFNQGFYNLFLAVGTGIGCGAFAADHGVGRALIGLGCGAMLGAALVLIGSDRRMARAAALQGTLPLIALITIW